MFYQPQLKQINKMKELIEKLVFEALGEASMCWSETPKGIFDSNKATEIGNRLTQAIQALSQSEWVSVEDRLPDSIGSYLCIWENCYVGMLFFNSNKEWCEMWQQEKHNPTHWMPLPQPHQTK